MAFDIYLTFKHLPSGTSMSGYLNKEPLSVQDDGEVVTREIAEAIVDEFQGVFLGGQLNSISLFQRAEGSQVSIRKSTLADCVLVCRLFEEEL